MLDVDPVKTPGRDTITVKNPEPYNRASDVSGGHWGFEPGFFITAEQALTAERNLCAR